MNKHNFKDAVASWPMMLFCLIFLWSCAHRSVKPYDGPTGKVISLTEGGAYVVQERGRFEIGDEIIISEKKCREVPVRLGPMKTCSFYEYGIGKVERRVEDGHLFIRTDAISTPIGIQIRLNDGNPN